VIRLLAIIAGLFSVFFVFYTIRLLIVTSGLQEIRPAGQGAYIGAVIFPILAIALGWASIRAWRWVPRKRRQSGIDSY
jgi:H+/Cl- antiporter ClcA